MARAPRNYAAEYAARKQRAQQRGFKGYGQQRRVRSQYGDDARRLLTNYNLSINVSTANGREQFDTLVKIMSDVQRGGTGLSADELHGQIEMIFNTWAGEVDRYYVMDDEWIDTETDNEAPWEMIRSFYPRKRPG